MYFFMFLAFTALVPIVVTINVTNSGNQHEINDMKKDLNMLRNLVSNWNTSLQTVQTVKDEKLKEMNATIQTQQMEMRNISATIQAKDLEIRSMNVTIQDQLIEMRSMNATIQDQHLEMRSMNSKIQTQQQEISFLIGTVQGQQQKIAFMEDNSAQIEMINKLNETGNKNYEAFQLIVQDLVTNVNNLKNSNQVQLRNVNDNLTTVASQIHYTSLSFLDAQRKLAALEDDTKETKTNLSSVVNKLKIQEQELHGLSSETITNLSSVVNKLKTQELQMHGLSSEINRTIAFTVSTSSDLTNYNSKTIIYDKVITNIGGAYNSKTGIFTCPVPGAYIFTWSTVSRSVCITYIYHNGNQLLVSYSHESNGGYHEVASNTITLALTSGDRVWIQTDHSDYCIGYPYTGFSGWKL